MSFAIDNVANIRTGLNIPSGAPKASLDMCSILGAALSIRSNPYDVYYLFSMLVLKGNYSGISKGSIWMAGNFPGQEKELGEVWPMSKCEQGNRDLKQNPSKTKKMYNCASIDLNKDLT
ncbi:uncharacterized protein FTOL_07301 [Fusarium torulosum]|uniref:Uncharacterized protein n=1 Tax=Fusarium torulosum TaxID=33205 RepID=A0AAE8SJB3_9HYPO|nr:uncharacterized protein FTOL_07301 [Fusarium torulosum]